MLDGPATVAVVFRPAAPAAPGSAPRSAESPGRASAGQRVVISTWVGWVPGQPASTTAALDRSRARAAVSSRAGVRRTSTLKVHRSGTVEYPSPPLIAVTVSLVGRGKCGPAGTGSCALQSSEIRAAALAMAPGAALLPPEWPAT